jgi:hypothetical protein
LLRRIPLIEKYFIATASARRGEREREREEKEEIEEKKAGRRRSGRESGARGVSETLAEA